jgi:molecular chaperone GrpE (heat shock protein)
VADERGTKADGRLEALAADMAAVRELLDEQGAQTRLQQRAFDALYDELRQYKDDFIFQAEKPLLLDLLLFYDSLNWFQQSLIKGEMSPEVVTDSFQYLIDEFLELLYRRDVVATETSTTFSRETQKAIKVLPTQSASQDYLVSQVLKRGFRRADRLLRPEEVVILRHGGSGEGDDG